ncbi:MAG: hypothetical protein IT286_03620, partial [Proteobacteria bacterium]|nr:hypothetical protein [Pseudomonadota bacterium]
FTRDSNLLFALPIEFSSRPEIVEEVKARIPKIFKFSQNPPSAELYRKEMSGTKDRLITAIRSQALGQVDELSKTYIALAEVFLSEIHAFGGGYSPEQAQKELSSIVGSWEEMGWIMQDVRELMNVAVESKNKDIFADIGYIPVAIASRAVRAEDHLLYRQFLVLIPYEYYLGRNLNTSDIRSFIIDRSWRYLKEFIEFNIEYKFNESTQELSVQEATNYQAFAQFALKVCQNFLKSAFDAKDIETFKTATTAFSGLFRRLGKSEVNRQIEVLKNQLTNDPTNQDLIRRLDQRTAVKKSIDAVQLAKNQMWFGLSALILDRYKQDSNNADLKKFFEILSACIPSDLNKLTSIFVESRTFQTEDLWGWGDWDMVADGKVHSIDFLSKLDLIFCIKALHILATKEQRQIDAIQIPHSRILSDVCDGRPNTNKLNGILDRIKSAPLNWSFVLDQKQIEMIDQLKSLLSAAVEAQKKEEENHLISAELDSTKIEEFKDNFLSEFKKTSCLRKVSIRFGIFRDELQNQPPTTILSWGFNQIDEKAAFIKDWHVSYIRWGENYGHNMAASEDEIVFEKMIEEIEDKQQVSVSSIVEKIASSILTKKLATPVVLQSLMKRFYFYDVVKSPDFIPHYHPSCPETELRHVPGFMGILRVAGKDVPVIDIYTRKEELKDYIVVTDVKMLGLWTQYSPINELKDPGVVLDVFEIKIIDLNKDETHRKSLIEGNKWLKKKSDADSFLKKRVHVTIYQKFLFEINNPNAGSVLSIKEQTDEK